VVREELSQLEEEEEHRGKGLKLESIARQYHHFGVDAYEFIDRD
jgi:hypothetical protein